VEELEETPANHNVPNCLNNFSYLLRSQLTLCAGGSLDPAIPEAAVAKEGEPSAKQRWRSGK
jgi:hypothetical protein